MTEGPISLDELLAKQSSSYELMATIEPIADQVDRVKITPFIAREGCECTSSLTIRREAVGELRPTGEVHRCCGKRLMIVAVQFNDETIADVFAQLAEQANRRAEEKQVRSAASGSFRPVLISNEGHDPSTAHAWDPESLMAGYRINHLTGMPVRHNSFHAEPCASAYGTCMLRCGLDDWQCICRCQNAYDSCLDPHAPQRACGQHR